MSLINKYVYIKRCANVLKFKCAQIPVCANSSVRKFDVRKFDVRKFDVRKVESPTVQ